MHRELIVTLAARHRLPAVYAFRVYVAGSGLMFYGPNSTDPYRRAAGYVDRILKREKHALPAPLRHPARGCRTTSDSPSAGFSDKQPAWAS
jgi:putative ABC transport system substrate-binding protein